MRQKNLNEVEVKIHPDTGEKLVRNVYPTTITYKGISQTFDMPGWYTEDGGDAIYTKDDMKEYDLAMKQLKARHEKLLSAEEIKVIRKKLNLTQAEAGNLIGGGPRAFQKYESGEVLPSRAASNLLRILDKSPALLQELSM